MTPRKQDVRDVNGAAGEEEAGGGDCMGVGEGEERDVVDRVGWGGEREWGKCR